jgi:PAS domain-containing protein
MSGPVTRNLGQVDLRLRAVQQLKGAAGSPTPIPRQSPSAALGVLFEMASEPSTAGSALAVLHELQVHQVELELQDEELRRSREELEVTLRRQTQLYDHAPVGYFTIDRAGALRELNLTGVAMLGCVRDQLRGRTLFSFLAPLSATGLQGMLARLTDGALCESGALQLVVGGGPPRCVRASAKRDPDGECFLVAFIDAPEPEDSQKG